MTEPSTAVSQDPSSDAPTSISFRHMAGGDTRMRVSGLERDVALEGSSGAANGGLHCRDPSDSVDLARLRRSSRATRGLELEMPYDGAPVAGGQCGSERDSAHARTVQFPDSVPPTSLCPRLRPDHLLRSALNRQRPPRARIQPPSVSDAFVFGALGLDPLIQILRDWAVRNFKFGNRGIGRSLNQAKTTVLRPQTRTRSVRWWRTARASTTVSRSRPIRTRSATPSRWLTGTTSCSMIGP